MGGVDLGVFPSDVASQRFPAILLDTEHVFIHSPWMQRRASMLEMSGFWFPPPRINAPPHPAMPDGTTGPASSNGPNNGASEPATDLHGQRRPAAVIGSRTHGGAVQLSPNLMPELAELAALTALAGLLSSTHTRGPSRMPLALL